MALVSLLSPPGKLFSDMTLTSFTPYREGSAQGPPPQSASLATLSGGHSSRSHSVPFAHRMSLCSLTTTCHTERQHDLVSFSCPQKAGLLGAETALCAVSRAPRASTAGRGALRNPLVHSALHPSLLQNFPRGRERPMVRASNTSATSTEATEHCHGYISTATRGSGY